MSRSRDEDWVDAEETRARLILDASRGVDDQLLACLDHAAVAAVLTAPDIENWADLVPHCAATMTALIGHLGPNASPELDGAFNGCELADCTAVQSWRERRGPDFIIGARVGTSRHEAMVAGEAGADYVVFGGPAAANGAEHSGEIEALCQWWNTVTVLPCAVVGVSDPDQARSWAEAGADFIIIGATLGQGSTLAPILDAYIRAINVVRRESW